MGPPDHINLTLSIDPVSDPITGALGDCHGKRIDFSGWIGFAAALEELLGAERQSATAQHVDELSPERM